MTEIHQVNRIERSGGRLGFFVLTALLATAIDIGAFVLLGEGGLGQWQRLAVALMPLPGNITLIVLALRAIRKLDEFQKRVHFEAVTIAFLSTGVAVFVYGYLQKAQAVGPFNRGFIWLLMALFYGIGYLISTSHYK